MDNYFEITYKTFGMYRPKVEHLYQYRELFINKIVNRTRSVDFRRRSYRKRENADWKQGC